MILWEIELRGGEWDGQKAVYDEYPDLVLVMFRCHIQCEGHGTFDVNDPYIDIRTAVAYNRTEIDEEKHWALYEVGESLGSGKEDEYRDDLPIIQTREKEFV